MLAEPLPRQCPWGFALDGDAVERLYNRLPRKPYCTKDLSRGLMIRDWNQAIEMPYIQLNQPTQRHVIVIDVDDPQATIAWEHVAPTPNLTIKNPKNGHAHLLYSLDEPVCVSGQARMGPVRYLAAVTDALNDAVGGDPGYTGHIAKTPTIPDWQTLEWTPEPYSLEDLAWSLDLDRHQARERRTPVSGTLHAGWRNVGLFDGLRYWAYGAISSFRDRGDWSGWCAAVMSRASAINAEQCDPPLGTVEVRATARSVMRWVWNRYEARASDAQFSAVQASRASRKGSALRQDGLELLRKGLSVRDVAEATGASQRTVKRWRKRLAEPGG